jgi:hypothetical protein
MHQINALLWCLVGVAFIIRGFYRGYLKLLINQSLVCSLRFVGQMLIQKLAESYSPYAPAVYLHRK